MFRKRKPNEDIEKIINFIQSCDILDEKSLCIDLLNFVSENNLYYLFMSKVYLDRLNSRLDDLNLKHVNI